MSGEGLIPDDRRDDRSGAAGSSPAQGQSDRSSSSATPDAREKGGGQRDGYDRSGQERGTAVADAATAGEVNEEECERRERHELRDAPSTSVQLDEGIEESMDASDPPSTLQP